MMISPEMLIDEYKDKKYEELLAIRDELMKDIRAFEEHGEDKGAGFVSPSPEVVYQCNLQYLGKLCELIAEKYNEEIVWGEE